MQKRNLLYLLIFIIPVQLGAHFFFDFSQIAGIYSDYFTPTIYLTDFIILVLILLDIRERKFKIGKLPLIFLGLCLFSSLFIAVNKWAAIYKFLKIVEFMWLFKIIVNIRFKFKNVLTAYSLAIIYASILAISQFILQRTVGGLWWSLGERTFYASTPGIALGRVLGVLFLRPYATFAHPNILGGFLALGLIFLIPFLWKERRLKDNPVNKLLRAIYIAALILGIIALILSFSRAAWMVFSAGLILTGITEIKKVRYLLVLKRYWYFWIFIFLFIISIIIPLIFSKSAGLRSGSLFERNQLISTALTIIKGNPLTGSGLNNSIISQYYLMPKNFGFFTMQPVHNVYLLIATELGIIGFLFLLVFLKKIFERINQRNARQFLPFFMIVFLGFFDHYLVTLQQGMLILVMFTSLVFWNQKWDKSDKI